MMKRLFLILAGAAGLLAVSPAVSLWSSNALDAAEGKLNYYRVPGGDPVCADACDGMACCTTPGGGVEDS